MVHALQQVRSLLQPNGVLISVHDLPAPHAIAVHTPDRLTWVGWLVDRDDFDSTRASLNALAQVVSDGVYLLEDERDFGYNITAGSLPELQEWLADWWSSAILTRKITQRLAELTRDAGQPTRIVVAIRARMTKLRTA